jgi:O-6-methylguanine DNA methyltransferase
MWFTYILRCSDDSFYIGISNDVKKRFLNHKNNKGGRYTRSHKVVKVVYKEHFKTKSEALKREFELKRLSHREKEALIKNTMFFCDRVYTIVAKIPKGKVATYGQIARLSGNAKAARAVGMCMRTNPFAPRVPCHRVVGSDGALVGFSGGKGITTKKSMLQKEGVKFIGDKVDLPRSQWN